MAMQGIFLSVVIPAYNEADSFRLGRLGPVVEYLQKQRYSWEVILVDDGSTDETNELLDQFRKHYQGFKLLRIEHGGKAAAVTAGMLAARGKIILFTDFDQSTPISEVSKFIDRHQAGADVVISFRATRHDTLIARIRGRAFVALVRLVALPGIVDSQCGFKSFKNAAAKKVFANLLVSKSQGKISEGYMGAFDVEVLFLARKYGFRIDQVPVKWTRYVSNRLNIWKEPIRMAYDTFRVRMYDILRLYAG